VDRERKAVLFLDEYLSTSGSKSTGHRGEGGGSEGGMLYGTATVQNNAVLSEEKKPAKKSYVQKNRGRLLGEEVQIGRARELSFEVVSSRLQGKRGGDRNERKGTNGKLEQD